MKVLTWCFKSWLTRSVLDTIHRRFRLTRYTWNKENRKLLKKLGIVCHCPPLGRPKKNPDLEEEKLRRQASSERNSVEATFGTAKRIYRANNIRAKLKETARTWIAACFFAKNLKKFLTGLLCLLLEKALRLQQFLNTTGTSGYFGEPCAIWGEWWIGLFSEPYNTFWVKHRQSFCKKLRSIIQDIYLKPHRRQYPFYFLILLSDKSFSAR